MGKVVVIVGLVFAVLGLVCAAVALSGLDKGWWRFPDESYPRYGLLRVHLTSNADCKYERNTLVCPGGPDDIVDPIVHGGKAALAACVIALVCFFAAILFGIARLFKKFGTNVGMGAAAFAFMGAFFITCAWAIMVGVFINWWRELDISDDNLEGDYALGIACAGTLMGIIAGGCFAYAH